MAQNEQVPHDNFAAGFAVGFQLVMGATASVPQVPTEPTTPAESTPFLEGVKLGVRWAGAQIDVALP